MIDESLENLQRLRVRHGDHARWDQRRVFNLNKSHTDACMRAHTMPKQALYLQWFFIYRIIYICDIFGKKMNISKNILSYFFFIKKVLNFSVSPSKL